MVSRRQRRLQRKRRIRVVEAPVVKRTTRTGIDAFYHDHYKPLFLITIALLVLSLVTIGVTYVSTGEVFYKGVSLSGGITVTIPTEISADEVESKLLQAFPTADIVVREMTNLGRQIALVIEAAPVDMSDLVGFEKSVLSELETFIPDVRDVASTEVVGSSLGRSFFRQTAKAVLIAFTFMGLVVFFYFGDSKSSKAIVLLGTFVEAMLIWNANNIFLVILAVLLGGVLIYSYIKFSIPSAAVILAAVSTILFTVAVIDIMQMRVSTAGIAAFLMLIGYSVDTDILLSTRVLRRSEGSVYDRVVGALKTGMTMECSTLAAALVALIFSQSSVIREIMTIIFIGLVADIFFTWIQNAGILRLYLEKRSVKRA